VKSTSILFSGLLLAAASPLACSSSDSAGDGDAGPPISLGDGGFVDAPEQDGSRPQVDGGFPGPDGSVLRADRFATKVVSFTPGDCAGFGLTAMPGVVLGPPVGGGDSYGSLDVVSLGSRARSFSASSRTPSSTARASTSSSSRTRSSPAASRTRSSARSA